MYITPPLLIAITPPAQQKRSGVYSAPATPGPPNTPHFGLLKKFVKALLTPSEAPDLQKKPQPKKVNPHTKADQSIAAAQNHLNKCFTKNGYFNGNKAMYYGAKRNIARLEGYKKHLRQEGIMPED